MADNGHKELIFESEEENQLEEVDKKTQPAVADSK